MSDISTSEEEEYADANVSEYIDEAFFSLKLANTSFPNEISIYSSVELEFLSFIGARSRVITNLKLLNAFLSSLSIQNESNNPIHLEKMMKIDENQVLTNRIQSMDISTPHNIKRILIDPQIVNCYVPVLFGGYVHCTFRVPWTHSEHKKGGTPFVDRTICTLSPLVHSTHYYLLQKSTLCKKGHSRVSLSSAHSTHA